VVDEQNPNRVVTATAYGVGGHLVPRDVYESHDAGRSWTQLADGGEVVRQLTINQGAISCVTANGLVRYGEPPEPSLADPGCT
jgi:hypothetical protein